MNKLLSIGGFLLAAVLVPACVFADYLYCFVDEPEYNGTKVQYDYATVAVAGVGGANPSDSLEFYAGGATTSSGDAMSRTSTEALYAELPLDYSSYSTFLFELWSMESDKRVAWNVFSISAADAHGNIVKGYSTSGGTPLTVTEVIPEPTGGVLVLLGLAALAVRRKNKGDLN